jgi:hypothetical protein
MAATAASALRLALRVPVALALILGAVAGETTTVTSDVSTKNAIGMAATAVIGQ